eukprot:3523196-Pyramimonas_sp.AAC.1
MDFLVVGAAARRVEELGGRQVMMPQASAVQASASGDPQEIEKKGVQEVLGGNANIDCDLAFEGL